MPLVDVPSLDAEDARRADDSRAVYEMIAGQWVSSTVRTAAELGIVDALGDGPRTAESVAAATDCDPATMRRLLVACTSLGLFSEDERGAFRPTSKGALLGDREPGSLRALARLQSAPGVWQLWGALPDAIRQGGSQAAALLGADYFSFLAAHPDEAGLFAAAMGDLTGIILDEARRIIDFGAAREVLDVGGGNGSFLIGLLEAHPELRGRVLERTQEAELARRAGTNAGVMDRFEAISGDFFAEIPAADYYIVKLVLHDWDDEQCHRLLANCRAAAPPHARLLVIEALIDEADDDPAVDLGAMMDMTILQLTPGRERRCSEYMRLLTAAGWACDQVVATRSIYALIESVPA